MKTTTTFLTFAAATTFLLASAALADRWGGDGSPGAYPSSTPGGGSGALQTTLSGKLTVGARVPAKLCRANPAACHCPRGSVSRIFYESASYSDAPVEKYACVASACQPGTQLRKTVNAETGATTFSCQGAAQ
jgi:hypothetical protein